MALARTGTMDILAQLLEKAPPEVMKALRAAGASCNTSGYKPGPIRIDTPQALKDPGILSANVYDCPDCLNHGIILFRDERGIVRGRECDCMVRRRGIVRLKKSGLGELVKRYTFQNYQARQPWQAKAKAAAERYAIAPEGWFLACGAVGSGKTHLCTAVAAKLLANGRDVRYMLWRDVATQAKAVVNDAAGYAAIMEPLKNAEVLYIDDMYKTGKGQAPTVGDVNFAFEIINSRYNQAEKLTIISTELTIPALMDVDQAVGSRIYERSKSHCLVFEGSDKNWRLYG